MNESPADRLVAAAERAAGCNLAVTGDELERPAVTGGARLLCGCGLSEPTMVRTCRMVAGCRAPRGVER